MISIRGGLTNIILLSGGSGKRLWPLSNDSRSKQFLRLIKNKDGKYESMVQRVYRQICEAGIKANIVVATGASQVDSIRTQLGSTVDIVVEPERRDTFPAIALSASFLYFEKHVQADEVVVVLPVDPYAEIEYFKTLQKMEQAVKQNAADMVLMGIQPSYPSSKYGYIIPDEPKNGINPVKTFIEKPDEEKASKLISDGGVWNGGVFSFKLSYIMEIIKKYVNVSSYKEMLESYSSLKKISFDYEVVEKAKSIAMIPYGATWKDLGTWNTLTEEIEDTVIGAAVVGEGTHNTHVINELSIPVVVLGAKNMVVAASPDGILIADKQKSSYLKPYVDALGGRPMYEERNWGHYKVLDYDQYSDGARSLTKHLTIKADKFVSYQRHNIRDEILTIIDGTGELLIDGHARNVRRGDVVYIVKGQKHALKAVTDMQLIEVQIGTELFEDDVEEFNMLQERKRLV